MSRDLLVGVGHAKEKLNHTRFFSFFQISLAWARSPASAQTLGRALTQPQTRPQGALAPVLVIWSRLLLSLQCLARPTGRYFLWWCFSWDSCFDEWTLSRRVAANELVLYFLPSPSPPLTLFHFHICDTITSLLPAWLEIIDYELLFFFAICMINDIPSLSVSYGHNPCLCCFFRWTLFLPLYLLFGMDVNPP